MHLFLLKKYTFRYYEYVAFTNIVLLWIQEDVHLSQKRDEHIPIIPGTQVAKPCFPIGVILKLRVCTNIFARTQVWTHRAESDSILEVDVAGVWYLVSW